MRRALRMSVRVYAEHLGVAFRTVADWEARGAGICPRPDTQAILDTALGQAGHEVQARFESILRGSGQGEENATDRRDAAKLIGLTAIAAATNGNLQESSDSAAAAKSPLRSTPFQPKVDDPDPTDALDALRMAHEWLVLEPPQVFERRSGRRIGDDLLSTLEERVKELRLLDDRLAGGDTHELVSRELSATLMLLDDSSYTEMIGRRLLSIAGELAQLAGWVMSDAGLHDRAARYYILGVRAAHSAGNRAVAANNLSSLAYQLANVGRPDEAILLARSAVSGAQHEAPLVQALLLERVGWAHATAGEARQAEYALGQAQEALDRAAASYDSPSWLYWLDRREADVMAGRCFTELRRPLKAVPILETTTASYPAEAPRELALYLSWLAVAYADAHEIEESCRTAQRVLTLSQDVHSARITERLNVILNRLDKHSNTQAVRELKDAIR